MAYDGVAPQPETDGDDLVRDDPTFDAWRTRSRAHSGSPRSLAGRTAPAMPSDA
jgi:hypothetical protein